MTELNLLHGDCLEVMRAIPDESVDMILADLPYGTTQCAWDVVIPFAALWEQYLRIAKPESAIVLCAAQPFASLMVSSNTRDYKYEWIWEKGAATGFLNAKKQPLRAHESAQVFYRKQPVYNPRMTTGHERKTSKRKSVESECYGKALNLTEYDSTERYPRSVQFFSSDKQTASYHPTQKPVAWMSFLISTYTNPGQVVMDNTMGSGTTGVACLQLGRKFIGIERDEKIFGTAKARLDAEVLRLSTPEPQLSLFKEACA
ncbi:site-specific DNA-methyltransferase [Pseudomonas synxantha]|uniref:Methyltransferase n=1 Tax=Pseudomonas synxantha TaxID=47883 RepID=A0ABS0UCH9_9PSED|nr:site-specific DNA-methyltransferase [Pseudomonas synxantha]MBI6563285.1 site-specific DNA-methyltransferase [Pseudomonas synxantha]MBI6582089.1 site-specific DNA-methyltransferase [Pseudomonas synxantha]MBI6643690.1 site-specific DNA-methyltransferase [Pseudomonas synxantha]